MHEAVSSVVPRIIAVVEALQEWYHTMYPQADEQDKNSQETALRKIIVSTIQTLCGDHNKNGHSGHISMSHTGASTVRGH